MKRHRIHFAIQTFWGLVSFRWSILMNSLWYRVQLLILINVVCNWWGYGCDLQHLRWRIPCAFWQWQFRWCICRVLLSSFCVLGFLVVSPQRRVADRSGCMSWPFFYVAPQGLDYVSAFRLVHTTPTGLINVCCLLVQSYLVITITVSYKLCAYPELHRSAMPPAPAGRHVPSPNGAQGIAEFKREQSPEGLPNQHRSVSKSECNIP